MAVTGWIITMFAEMFGVELAAIVEASTEETAKEEDKKAEKTSLKEENKEVCENVEIKVDEREKPKVPVSLFDVSPGFVRPVVLSKPELDLLPEPLKIPMDLSHKQAINNEDSKVQKPKVEERKPEPKKEVCPPKVPEQPVKKEPEKVQSVGSQSNSTKSRRRNLSNNNQRDIPSDNQQKQASNGKSNASTAQHNSVGDAQPPKRLIDDVKVNNHVDSIRKAPEKAPSRE